MEEGDENFTTVRRTARARKVNPRFVGDDIDESYMKMVGRITASNYSKDKKDELGEKALNEAEGEADSNENGQKPVQELAVKRSKEGSGFSIALKTVSVKRLKKGNKNSPGDSATVLAQKPIPGAAGSLIVRYRSSTESEASEDSVENEAERKRKLESLLEDSNQKRPRNESVGEVKLCLSADSKVDTPVSSEQDSAVNPVVNDINATSPCNVSEMGRNLNKSSLSSPANVNSDSNSAAAGSSQSNKSFSAFQSAFVSFSKLEQTQPKIVLASESKLNFPGKKLKILSLKPITFNENSSPVSQSSTNSDLVLAKGGPLELKIVKKHDFPNTSATSDTNIKKKKKTQKSGKEPKKKISTSQTPVNKKTAATNWFSSDGEDDLPLNMLLQKQVVSKKKKKVSQKATNQKPKLQQDGKVKMTKNLLAKGKKKYQDDMPLKSLLIKKSKSLMKGITGQKVSKKGENKPPHGEFPTAIKKKNLNSSQIAFLKEKKKLANFNKKQLSTSSKESKAAEVAKQKETNQIKAKKLDKEKGKVLGNNMKVSKTSKLTNKLRFKFPQKNTSKDVPIANETTNIVVSVSGIEGDYACVSIDKDHISSKAEAAKDSKENFSSETTNNKVKKDLSNDQPSKKYTFNSGLVLEEDLKPAKGNDTSFDSGKLKKRSIIPDSPKESNKRQGESEAKVSRDKLSKKLAEQDSPKIKKSKTSKSSLFEAKTPKRDPEIVADKQKDLKLKITKTEPDKDNKKINSSKRSTDLDYKVFGKVIANDLVIEESSMSRKTIDVKQESEKPNLKNLDSSALEISSHKKKKKDKIRDDKIKLKENKIKSEKHRTPESKSEKKSHIHEFDIKPDKFRHSEKSDQYKHSEKQRHSESKYDKRRHSDPRFEKHRHTDTKYERQHSHIDIKSEKYAHTDLKGEKTRHSDQSKSKHDKENKKSKHKDDQSAFGSRSSSIDSNRQSFKKECVESTLQVDTFSNKVEKESVNLSTSTSRSNKHSTSITSKPGVTGSPNKSISSSGKPIISGSPGKPVTSSFVKPTDSSSPGKLSEKDSKEPVTPLKVKKKENFEEALLGVELSKLSSKASKSIDGGKTDKKKERDDKAKKLNNETRQSSKDIKQEISEKNDSADKSSSNSDAVKIKSDPHERTIKKEDKNRHKDDRRHSTGSSTSKERRISHQDSKDGIKNNFDSFMAYDEKDKKRKREEKDRSRHSSHHKKHKHESESHPRSSSVSASDSAEDRKPRDLVSKEHKEKNTTSKHQKRLHSESYERERSKVAVKYEDKKDIIINRIVDGDKVSDESEHIKQEVYAPTFTSSAVKSVKQEPHISGSPVSTKPEIKPDLVIDEEYLINTDHGNLKKEMEQEAISLSTVSEVQGSEPTIKKEPHMSHKILEGSPYCTTSKTKEQRQNSIEDNKAQIKISTDEEDYPQVNSQVAAMNVDLKKGDHDSDTEIFEVCDTDPLMIMEGKTNLINKEEVSDLGIFEELKGFDKKGISGTRTELGNEISKDQERTIKEEESNLQEQDRTHKEQEKALPEQEKTVHKMEVIDESVALRSGDESEIHAGSEVEIDSPDNKVQLSSSAEPKLAKDVDNYADVSESIKNDVDDIQTVSNEYMEDVLEHTNTTFTKEESCNTSYLETELDKGADNLDNVVDPMADKMKDDLSLEAHDTSSTLGSIPLPGEAKISPDEDESSDEIEDYTAYDPDDFIGVAHIDEDKENYVPDDDITPLSSPEEEESKKREVTPPREFTAEEKEERDRINKKIVEQRMKTFELLDENLYLVEKVKNKRSKEAKRMVCDCSLTKEEINNDEMACGEDCLNRLLMIECGSRCNMKERCLNKRFQQKCYANVEVFNAEEKGCGVRACDDIQPGTFIMEYVGEVFDTREFKRRRKEYAKGTSAHFYFMALRSDRLIDATMKGNISRFINHSCSPNAQTQKWTVNGDIRIGFFATTFIEKGEEINFDYRLERYGREPQKCFCGTPVCRGWLGEPPDQKTKEEKEEDRRKMKERARREGRRTSFLEDMDLEDEIEKLNSRGLRNREDTLTLSRLMVRCEDAESRLSLLQILESSESASQRLFLDYHGLKLLWSWMVDISSSQKCNKLKLEILKTLRCLPITNKTQVTDSKVYDIVERWSKMEAKDEPGKGESKKVAVVLEEGGKDDTVSDAKKLSDTSEDSDTEASEAKDSDPSPPDTVSPDDSSLDSVAGALLIDPTTASTDPTVTEVADTSPAEHVSAEPASAEFASAEFASAEPVSAEAVSAEFASAEPVSTAPAEVEEIKAKSPVEEIRDLALKLLEIWSDLKEAFRIPKRQRIELMKEHEREVEKEYEKYLGRHSDDRSRDAFYDRWRYNASNKDRDRVREKERERERRREKRRSRGRREEEEEKGLSKEERRERFAKQVAKEDEEMRQRKLQEEMWKLHLERCTLLGHDPYFTPIFDPSGQYYWDPAAGTWQPYVGPNGNLPVPAAYGMMHPDSVENVCPNIPMNNTMMVPGAFFPLPQTPLSEGEGIPLVGDAVGGEGTTLDPSSIPLPGETPPLHTPTKGDSPAVVSIPLPGEGDDMEIDCVNGMDTPPPVAPPGPITVKLPSRWKMARDGERRIYFYHTKTRHTQWELPTPDLHQELMSRYGLDSESESDPESDSDSSSSSDSEDFSSSEDEKDEDEDKEEIVQIAESVNEKMIRRIKGKRARSEKLVQERVISPILFEDREAARRERKEAKERARDEARKERWQLIKALKMGNAGLLASNLLKREGKEKGSLAPKNFVDSVAPLDKKEDNLQEQLLKISRKGKSESKLHGKAKSKERAMTAMADTSDLARKIKENFRSRMATYIVSVLNPYRKPECKEGRITSNEDFKYLARKLTQFVMVKELKQLPSIDGLDCSESVKHKTKEFVRKYMSKYGGVFKRDPNDTKEY